MKRKFTRLGLMVGVAAGMLLAATPATATPPTGHNVGGYDEVPDLVVIQGSETTHLVSSVLSRTYNVSPGCNTNNTTALRDACAPGQAGPGAGSYSNWDHDLIVDGFSMGSGNGRAQLACFDDALDTTSSCTPAVQVQNRGDLVRSSSGIGTAALNTFWGIATESLPVGAVNPAVKSRSAGLGATQAQIQAVFENNDNVCQATVTWAQLGDTGPNASDTVLPLPMNSGAGTYGSFSTLYGITDPNGADCNTIQTPPPGGAATSTFTPLENEMAQLRNPGGALCTPALPGNAAGNAVMEQAYCSGQYIWWMSGATVLAFPVQATTFSPLLVNGVSFTSSSFLARRVVGYVSRDTDAAFCTGAAAPVAGCTQASSSANYEIGNNGVANNAGKAGALREFVRWVCRLNRHQSNPTIPGATAAQSYVTTISGAIQAHGFSTTVSGANFGRCAAST